MTFWDDGVIQLRFHPNRKFPSNFVRWPLKAERGCSGGNFWKILMLAAETLIGFSFPPKKAEKVEHRQIKRHDVYRTGHQLKCQFVRRCVRYTPAKKWSARLMISEKNATLNIFIYCKRDLFLGIKSHSSRPRRFTVRLLFILGQ